MGPIDQSISAGLGGFLALFLLAAALWLLMRSLLKHLRNAEHHGFEEDESTPARVVLSRPSQAAQARGETPVGGAGRMQRAQNPEAPVSPGEVSGKPE